MGQESRPEVRNQLSTCRGGRRNPGNTLPWLPHLPALTAAAQLRSETCHGPRPERHRSPVGVPLFSLTLQLALGAASRQLEERREGQQRCQPGRAPPGNLVPPPAGTLNPLRLSAYLA